MHMIPELQLHDREELRRSLMSLRKSHIKDIVLFCDQRDLVTIMSEVTVGNKLTPPLPPPFLSRTIGKLGKGRSECYPVPMTFLPLSLRPKCPRNEIRQRGHPCVTQLKK